MSSGSTDVSAIYELLYNPTYRPRRSPSSHIDRILVGGEPAYILAKEPQSEYYDVDAPTKAIWDLADGNRTVGEIAEEAMKADDKLTAKDVRNVLVSLAEEGTLETTEQKTQRKRVEAVSALQLDVRLIDDSSKTLSGLFRLTRRLIRREELPAAIAFSVVGLLLSLGTFLHIYSDPSVLYIGGSAIIGFLFYQMLMLLPVYAVHELAHAAVCDYYGGKPKDIGTGLYYLAPFFYCDTTDSWRLSRRARIMICAAGPLSTLVISSALVVWSFFVAPGFAQDVLRISAFFGYYGTLVNLSPVIETDGYYMLADIVDIPNLRDEAFGYAKAAVLSLLRRPVKAGRRSLRERRIIALYSLIAVAWLAFFGYTTYWLMRLYASDAYSSARGIGLMLLRARAFDPAAFGLSAVTLAYFCLVIAGFCVMGSVAYGKLRMRGAKLETIHDKRAAVFLPLPSSMRDRGAELARRARKAAGAYSRSSSVALEPPLCVASLRLGRVEESVEATRARMQEVEGSFRKLHSDFLSGRRPRELAPGRDIAAGTLLGLSALLSGPEGREASARASAFVKGQDREASLLLQSAFGTIWTLEVNPDDYRRIRREVLPSLVAEDLTAAGLTTELEEFKRRVVLGTEAIAELSAQADRESNAVLRQQELYQVVVLNEPLKNRLVFLGRTEKVEAAMSWLGGLYMYQAWVSYMEEKLEDASLGLATIRLAPSASLTKTQAGTMRERERRRLERGLELLEGLGAAAEGAVASLESTYGSASNFHESLVSLMDVETYEVGLYKPILDANERRLGRFAARLKEFKAEQSKVSKRVSAAREALDAAMEGESRPGSRRPRGVAAVLESVREAAGRRATPGYEAQLRLLIATARLLYPIVACGESIQ